MNLDKKLQILRNAWVEIDLNAIANNLYQARRIVGPKTKIAAVVKANAYGHGALNVAKALIDNRVDLLSVACLSEALELRAHYSEMPIMILGYTPDEQLKHAAEHDIIMTIFDSAQAALLSAIGAKLNKKIIIHIKIDTGLNRIGLKPGPDTIATIAQIYGLNNIWIEGIFTHLALKSFATDKLQFDTFMDIISQIEAKGIQIPIKHVCDGIGMVSYPNYHLDMVRIGSFLYGIEPPGTRKSELALKMALTFKTKIAHVKNINEGEGVGYDYDFVAKRPSKIGTLPVGYVDGLMRCLAGKSEVSIKGLRAPIIGAICMDQCMIDLTDIPASRVGDEVVLMGENAQDCIPIYEIADNAGTIRNEILTMISRRVPRVYIKDEMIVDVVDYLLNNQY